MAKNIVFDQNNNVLKAWLPNTGVEQNDLARVIASEMCYKFGLQIVSVAKVQDVWGRNAVSRPLTKDDEVGTHKIGFVLGIEGMPVGWVTARISDQYGGVYQYEYHHTLYPRDMDQSYTQSKNLTSILNKVKKKFLGEFQGSYAEGISNFRSENIKSHEIEEMIHSVSNPQQIQNEKRRIDMPIEMREAVVNSLIDGVPIEDKSMLEQVKNVHAKFNALTAELNDTNRNYNKLHEKPIYMLGCSRMIPNMYTLIKLVQPPKKEGSFPKPIILDYEVFADGLENSKYKDKLTPVLTMWMIAKNDVLKDTKHSPIVGSLYHDSVQFGWDKGLALYDDALDIVCYSKRDEHDTSIILTDIIAFLDVD
tara:strand:- start:837 stop:1928 length:1092 start_codon:yes stop_codon:yes gene_type:complete